MTGYVIRHRDMKRREQMIDEAVRTCRNSWPYAWRLLTGKRVRNHVHFSDVIKFVNDVRAEFRRLAAK